ncbi:YfhO family protein [Hydrogenovibrio sp. 3SP14C1]|uniref:YfhO family protein n=1 Tax=Hydrogenovibrio sp. 3SP14C1 TaxID=3038774 RepID=UPI002417B423|nr:YfhO family protein [Hydrogenovibrio sp. 3SP14C1]MDG4812246.1 YfhO family protein [Hydrogenovibrio sp. 3SP14C1]
MRNFYKIVENDYFVLVYLIVISLLFFHPNLTGHGTTGWDTHDLIFVNFLYFTDAISSGYIPFWNPFIQSGVFFPNLNLSGLFTPFQLLFVFLAQIFNPAIVFEWMVQSYILFGGIGVYLYFKKIGISYQIAAFGTVAYVLSVLITFTGQISFVVSLSGFPWLLLFVHLVREGRYSFVPVALIGSISGCFLVAGYPWMNFVNGVLVVLYALSIGEKQKTFYIQVFFMLCFMAIIYLLFMLPGIMDLKFNYSLFNGDFINVEPRLRSMGVQPATFGYHSVFQALVNVIDPRLASYRTWVQGVGLLVGFAFILTLFSRYLNVTKNQVFWFFVGVVGVFYASSLSLGITHYINEIPIFNANRWMALGLFYTCIALIFITTYRLEKTSYFLKTYFVKYAFILILTNILYFFYAFTPHLNDSFYAQKVENRVKSVEFTENKRFMVPNNPSFYSFNDDWVLKKMLYNHGYNNLGNPWYWQFKGFDFIEEVVSVTRDVKQSDPYQRISADTDNTFYPKYTKNITYFFPSFGVDDSSINFSLDESFNYKINSILVSPNETKIELVSSNSALISFNSPYAPGWNVYINGEKHKLVKVNGIFMGVVIPNKGSYEVKFRFDPLTAYISFSLAYLIIFILIIILVLQQRTVQKQR